MIEKQANDTCMRDVQCLNSLFLAPKFRLRRVQKTGKKAKNEKWRFAKKNFLFLRVHAWGQCELKKSCAREKFFLTFRRAIMEILS